MYNETYRNNYLYGSKMKPVIFDKIEKVNYKGEIIDVITANHEFFKNLRCGEDTDFRHFYGVLAFCAEFGDISSVYLKDGRCNRLIPLRSAFGGFNIHMDQIQPFCESRCLLHFSNCYDCNNDHVNILSKVYPRHRKCFTDGCHSDCGCDCDPIGECGCPEYPGPVGTCCGWMEETSLNDYCGPYRGVDAMKQPIIEK